MTNTIVVDWGTSHLRAYLCRELADGQLQLIDKKLALGVVKCQNKFEEELFNCIGSWLDVYGNLSITLSGQIGSSIGWKETPYIACPVIPSKVAKSCLNFTVRGGNISIVPGVSCKLGNENHDVMRSEELQVLGWLSIDKSHRHGLHLICLPGTHTKWVLVNNGTIMLFKTAMTGELYDLLNHQSVLIQKPSCAFDEDSFIEGAKYTLESEFGNFSHGVFSVRSKQLFGELSEKNASSYLSGVLIGSDVRAALHASEWDIESLLKVNIIGAPQLSDCFSKTLSLQGVKSTCFNVEETTLLGFSSINQLNQPEKVS
jgi:2-dehydro-3-deoxygalactonokinase